MANICLAKRDSGQTCTNCVWYVVDKAESSDRCIVRCCSARPDANGYVYWAGRFKKQKEKKSND